MFDFEYDGKPIVAKNISEAKKPERVLLEEGIANFVVEKAYPGISKSSGNNQLVVVIKATAESGRQASLWLYFPEKGKHDRLKSFLSSIGKSHLYSESGRFDENKLIRCSGACKIKIVFKEQFGNQNEVHYFLEKPNVVEPANATNTDTSNDWNNNEYNEDDIPF